MSHGHQVVSEPLTDEASDLVASWKPDVVVLSSEAADSDNGDILRKIQQHNPRPAILLTGQLDRFDAAWRAWRQGGDELLLKPVIHVWELHTAIIAAIESATPKLSESQAAASA
jgi:DNA-binding response OmpR family regulator